MSAAEARNRPRPAPVERPAGPLSRLTRLRKALFHRRPWWQNVLLVIGIVTVVTFVLVSFLGVDSRPRRISVSGEIGPVDSPTFVSAVSRLVGSPAEAGGTIGVLNNGDAFLPALLDALNAAESTINFSVFMWQTGTMSDRVLTTLIERQRAGIQVRVLLDGLGATGAYDRKFDDLTAAGGRVAKFRTPGIGSWWRVHRRNHRRAIVIDGRVGFTGGMAINDKWLGDARTPDEWRDMMFKLTGPPASSLQSAFADLWAATTGELLAGPGMYPPDVHDGAPGLGAFVHLAFSPPDDDHSLAFFYVAAILAARERVVIATPYFIPDLPLREALIEQARAGVDVRLLLPGGHIDNPLVRWSSHNHYQVLMEAGVKIYEYQPTFLHSKFVVVDGTWSILGSPNLNPRSRQLDEENVFGILDRGLGAELERVYAEDLTRAVPINPDEWRRRNPLKKLLELSVRVLDQQS